MNTYGCSYQSASGQNAARHDNHESQDSCKNQKKHKVKQMTDEEIEQYIQKIAGAKIAELREENVALADRVRQLQDMAATGRGRMVTARPASLSRMSREEYDDLANARVEITPLSEIVKATLPDGLYSNDAQWSRYVKREGATVK